MRTLFTATDIENVADVMIKTLRDYGITIPESEQNKFESDLTYELLCHFEKLADAGKVAMVVNSSDEEVDDWKYEEKIDETARKAQKAKLYLALTPYELKNEIISTMLSLRSVRDLLRSSGKPEELIAIFLAGKDNELINVLNGIEFGGDRLQCEVGPTKETEKQWIRLGVGECFIFIYKDGTEKYQFGDLINEDGFESFDQAVWALDDNVLLRHIAAEKEPILRKNRCIDCCYLVEGENGAWICDDCGKNVESIPDDECSANQKF